MMVQCLMKFVLKFESLKYNFANQMKLLYITLTYSHSQAFCVGAVKKTSGHSRIYFVNPAGMLAEPIKTLRAICDNTNTQDAQSYEIYS